MKIKIYDNLSQFELARRLKGLGHELCIVPPEGVEPLFPVESTELTDDESDIVLKLCTDDFVVKHGHIGYSNSILDYERDRFKMEDLFDGIFKVPFVTSDTKKFVIKSTSIRPKVQIMEAPLPDRTDYRSYAFVDGVERTYCLWFDGSTFIDPLFEYQEFKDPEEGDTTGYRQDCIGLTVRVKRMYDLNIVQLSALARLHFMELQENKSDRQIK
jgi:hypothetical protein